MKNESLTLFIPLYGKALMSREGFLPDPMAEQIVSTVEHDFSTVNRSRKLAIYMAMRTALQRHFRHAAFIFDAYSRSAARLSVLKNPVNAVRAKIDFAMDDPSELLDGTQGMRAALNADIITPEAFSRLKGPDRLRFRFMGRFGKRFYRIFGYEITG